MFFQVHEYDSDTQQGYEAHASRELVYFGCCLELVRAASIGLYFCTTYSSAPLGCAGEGLFGVPPYHRHEIVLV